MPERMVSVDLKGSVGLRRGRLYGPGRGVLIPESLATSLGVRVSVPEVEKLGNSNITNTEVPPISKLAAHVASMDADAVRTMAKADERKSAMAIYVKRLRELEG